MMTSLPYSHVTIIHISSYGWTSVIKDDKGVSEAITHI